MTDITQAAVGDAISGALARLNASHQAVKQAAAQIYTGQVGVPAGSAAPPAGHGAGAPV